MPRLSFKHIASAAHAQQRGLGEMGKTESLKREALASFRRTGMISSNLTGKFHVMLSL